VHARFRDIALLQDPTARFLSPPIQSADNEKNVWNVTALFTTASQAKQRSSLPTEVRSRPATVTYSNVAALGLHFGDAEQLPFDEILTKRHNISFFSFCRLR
jgi:hypothetical protein